MKTEPVQFLNVDLDIQAKPEDNLEPILKDLGESIFILRHQENCEGIQYLSIELSDLCDVESPDLMIAAFIEKIKSLSPEGKEAWNSAYSKEFNIGYDSGKNSESICDVLSKDLLSSVVELGAHIGITIYPFLTKKEKKKRRKLMEKTAKKAEKKAKKEESKK